MLYLQDHFSLLTCYVNMATNRDSKKTDLDDKFEDFSNPWPFSYLFMSGEIKLLFVHVRGNKVGQVDHGPSYFSRQYEMCDL